MLQLFDRLSLRVKIGVGFGVLIALTLMADVMKGLGQREAFTAVGTFLGRDHQLAELTLKSSSSMLKARRSEKDFLLKLDELGYEEARARFVMPVRTHLAAVRDNMNSVRALNDGADLAEAARGVERVSREYETGFLQVVELYGRLGRREQGLADVMRRRSLEIEALLQQSGSLALIDAVLRLRDAEREYRLHPAPVNVQMFDARAAGLRHQQAAVALDPVRRRELLALLDAYQGAFHRYQDVQVAITSASMDYLAAVQAVEPMLDRLLASTGEGAARTRQVLHQVTQRSQWTVWGGAIATLLIGLAVALFIIRNIAQRVGEFMAFAGDLAAGNLAARLQDHGRNEFGVLAAALNRMAGALQGSQVRQAEQAVELRRLNRALRVLSACSDAVVYATSEMDLVQRICRHAVDLGGYRLAWVGYAGPAPECLIELVAHAGTDRDYFEQLRLSWGDDPQRRGLSGNAVRDSRMVLARRIADEPAAQPWREEAMRRGLESCVALPLRAKHGVLGTLSICADEADAFDNEEIKVLLKLADHLAHGIGSLREAEQRRRAERELKHRASFDALTGLANRFTLEARLAQSVADAKRHSNKLAVMLVDLDRFKLINDTLGHGVGDRVLQEAARALRGAVRESDTVARLGGDEFVVLVKDVAAPSDAVQVAEKLSAVLACPVRVDGHEIRLSASVGIALYPDDGDDAAAMMRKAGTAMGDAKALGGGTFRFFALGMNERVAARFAMEADLRRALERDELLVHYQPQVSLVSGCIVGAEALVRWRHPDKGMVAPIDFIPLAEETGLIEPLGQWVLEAVCRQLRQWLDAELPVPPVAVNLSARQFRQAGLVGTVEGALQRHCIEPGLLVLELTESAVMHDAEAAVQTLMQLKALGVRLSLDDFGTGYSSLSHLKRFPFDHLKIDRSFVRDITTDPDSALICKSVIGLAHSLKKSVVAEGVETEAQLHYLLRLNCDELQGYLFSRPVPADELATQLVAQRRLALPQGAGTHRKLLLVDPDAAAQKVCKRALRRDGYDVLTAAHPGEALALLATHDVQVVLSEQRMPQMSGTEFLSRVRELHPHTLRVILSGDADAQSLIEAINRGAIHRFFAKPCDHERLRADLRDAVAHQAAWEPNQAPRQLFREEPEEVSG